MSYGYKSKRLIARFLSIRIKNKYLTAAELEHIIDFMQHSFLEGRKELAPALSLLDNDPLAHDMDLDKTLKDGSQECWCRGLCTPQ